MENRPIIFLEADGKLAEKLNDYRPSSQIGNVEILIPVSVESLILGLRDLLDLIKESDTARLRRLKTAIGRLSGNTESPVVGAVVCGQFCQRKKIRLLSDKNYGVRINYADGRSEALRTLLADWSHLVDFELAIDDEKSWELASNVVNQLFYKQNN